VAAVPQFDDGDPVGETTYGSPGRGSVRIYRILLIVFCALVVGWILVVLVFAH
jgi:hypothetical protein